MQAIGQAAGAECPAILLPELADTNRRVAGAAAVVLARYGEEAALPILKKYGGYNGEMREARLMLGDPLLPNPVPIPTPMLKAIKKTAHIGMLPLSGLGQSLDDPKEAANMDRLAGVGFLGHAGLWECWWAEQETAFHDLMAPLLRPLRTTLPPAISGNIERPPRPLAEE
ncbi:MAG: hypothetical protein ACI8W8_002908 [Rhodothermales bacterium]|jgi:hypothetical protein